MYLEYQITFPSFQINMTRTKKNTQRRKGLILLNKDLDNRIIPGR